MFFNKEYSECKLEDLKFKDLTEEDLEVFTSHIKRRIHEWIAMITAAALGVFALVYAWFLSHNGTAYSIVVSVLALILFGVAWAMGGHPTLKAKGSIRGEVESSRYESAANGEANSAVDYFANIAFASSKQRVVDLKVPAFKEHKSRLTSQEHCPKEGTEVVIYKLSRRKYMFVYPKFAKKQNHFFYKA